jgi:curved DNA-binding protein
MKNHYKTLGVNGSATAAELRRAYRILARRYHPDLNPGKTSEERFKEIAAAYEVLSDAGRRRQYDVELESYQRQRLRPEIQKYFDQMQRAARAKPTARSSARQSARPQPRQTPPAPPKPKKILDSLLLNAREKWKQLQDWRNSIRADIMSRIPRLRPAGKDVYTSRISIIEASVSFREAIYGAKKTIEIAEGTQSRKVSVQIPPGVRNGSVVRLKGKGINAEDLVIITRIASHPFVSIQSKGIVVEVPITINEAICGANITVPTLDDQFVVRIPPGAQSGSEIRLKGRGVHFRDGTRGDLFIRVMVRVPQAVDAVGIREKAKELEDYYESSVRKDLPKTILDL